MSLPWVFGLLIFILGSAVGSFLNVLVYRSTRGQDWVKGRSRCEHCRKRISWYENIPLLSYLVLRGRCSGCAQPIDPIHPLVEFLTGSLFLWWYLVGFLFFHLSSAPMQTIQPLFWLIVGVLCVVIFVTDIKHMLIPTWAVGALLGLTLLYRVTLMLTGAMQLTDFLGSLLAAGVTAGFFFFLHAVTRGKGFGFGDVQLIVPLSLILGSWQRVTVAVFLAFITGAATGIALILFGKKQLKQAVPFGPFLLLGTLLALVWGYDLWDWYVKIIAV